MLIRWKELIVPGIAFFYAFSYWLQIRGQTRVVVMIPYGVILLLMGLIGLVIWLEAIAKGQERGRSGENNGSKDKAYNIKERIVGWAWAYKQELGFTFLSIGYYFAYEIIGFTLDNIIFLMVAFPLSGLNLKRSVVYTLFTVMIVYAAAELMQVNIPVAPWLR